MLSISEFIDRWSSSGGSERANYSLFLTELTEILGVDRPEPATDDSRNDNYRFERPVNITHTGKETKGYIDLYRKDCFILEAKQGVEKKAKTDENQLALLVDKGQPKGNRVGHGVRGSRRWDDTMLKARAQADRYARAVSKEDGWPPFLLIIDVGHVIELYSDFSGQGQGYTQFPDGNRYRISLEDLRDEETQNLLRAIWTDPTSLNPALQSTKVTREIAAHLAELGKSLESQGHDGETVARFLMRCLFSMFAEDVELIPKGSFTKLLVDLRGHPEHAAPSLKGLWEAMNTGGFSQVLMQDLKRFNGGLFKKADALPLDNVQLSLLIEAAESDWKQVEPAIFGTLLERALDKRQRHKLGAHYTPRAYVERLVTPIIMEPLREDWKDIQAAALTLANQDKMEEALKTVHGFHIKLCNVRVLDPACGSGNFLYVALEMMKRLEGEVTALMVELGETQTSFITVDPHQFLGIELNPWAANVAELVLWIGYLQWHFRTHGTASPSEPVLRDFRNIINADAVLEWKDRTPRMNDDGTPVTRWDGATTLRHNITGEEVPDPEARVQVYDYAKPKATKWPEATFIVGNPPFIGASRLRDSLGDGYVEALWNAYPKMPQSADLVMFWWEKSALATRAWVAKSHTGTRRFGLITTNSLRQTFNRRVLEPHLNDPKKPLSLLYAIPDHPWVDTLYGAAVRIAMTVGGKGNRAGQLLTVASEGKQEISEADGKPVIFHHQIGKIFANLQIGADVAGTKSLEANDNLASKGVMLVGKGFMITPEKARKLGLGTQPIIDNYIHHYVHGKDISGISRGLFVIDLYPLSQDLAKSKIPELFQYLYDHVRPQRLTNREQFRRDNWHWFGRTHKDYRSFTEGLDRFIVTIETSKHRFFQFVPSSTRADNKLIGIGLERAEYLAILSSNVHEKWSLSAGSWMGYGNDPVYAKTRCFDPFPFPDLSTLQKTNLRQLGEELDAHRKRQQAAHPKLTLTQMYNVLEKLRADDHIEGQDKEIYDQGLIGILRELHDQIDAAVAEAYDWPADLSDEEILFNLVALNKERVEEEARGHIRWLRPEYQDPKGAGTEAKDKQAEMDMGTAEITIDKLSWPKTLPEQIAAVREALTEMGEASPEQVARRFKRARVTSVQPLLESLAALGQAELINGDKYAA